MRLFHRVTLLTPESVELEFTLAGIGSRALALLIDYHILGLGLAIFWLIFAAFATQLLSYLETLDVNSSSVPLWLVAIAILSSFVISSGYFVFFEVLWQGQTPGKRFAKIRVVREDGRPVGLPQAVLRTLLRPIDDILFIGVFLIILNQREKRIGDWAAGTLVVQVERPQSRASMTFTQAAQQLAAQLPQVTNLSQLLPDDFVTITEYLERRSFMEPKARNDLSLKLARQARTLVELKTVPPQVTADQFLEALYLAYQQQFPIE